MREAHIQRAILDYLAYKRRFCQRLNTGGFRDSRGHFYRFAKPGTPDIVCCIDGRYVAIEVKAPKGRQTPEQVTFQRELEAAGGMYILARGIEDVEHL